jgi:hypothetical protein
MSLMHFAADTERRIQASIARAKGAWSEDIDPAEFSLHNVVVAVRDLDRAVELATPLGRGAACDAAPSRRNGKTELCAAIAIYSLLFDAKQGEIYLAAADREQAIAEVRRPREAFEPDPRARAQQLADRLAVELDVLAAAYERARDKPQP